MEVFYYLVFGVLGLIVAALELSKNNKDRVNTSSAFNSFKNNYLIVYSLMMGTMLSPTLLSFRVPDHVYKIINDASFRSDLGFEKRLIVWVWWEIEILFCFLANYCLL